LKEATSRLGRVGPSELVAVIGDLFYNFDETLMHL